MLLNACHTEEDMVGEPNWIVGGSFDRLLPVPPVVNGALVPLESVQSTAAVLKASESATLGYGTSILGPTIEAERGSLVTVDFHNFLQEETNIHWHGLALPEDMDGHPKDVVPPMDHYHYELPIQQRAGTYWYHPHPHGATARQVFMGLAGMFIVRDAEETALNLPSGEFEIPLIIQDKRFSGAVLDYSPSEEEIMTGYLGENIVVNGVHAPYVSVGNAWYRLRILNGSTARVYNLAFTNGLAMHIIGADGGLLRTPEQVAQIMLGPGERIDVVVDLTNRRQGEELFLVSNKFSEFNVQGRQGFKILKLKVDKQVSTDFSLPSQLSSIESIPPSQSISTRVFDIAGMAGGGAGHGMGRHAINGKIYEMDRIDETVNAGTTEIWEFNNSGGDEIHPMHIHGVQFQVLSRKGGRNTLMASEKGWKDTVLVMPGEKVQVIMTFPQYTGVFVMHCHNLEHEDDGMMINYRII